MNKIYGLRYDSKVWPKSPTTILVIDTSSWVFGIRIDKYYDYCDLTKRLRIHILCFQLCFRKYQEDIEREKIKEQNNGESNDM